MQELKIEIPEMTLTPPERCRGCGKKTKNMTVESKDGWLQIPCTPGCELFVCTACWVVHTNSDALINILRVNESIEKAQTSRIVTPTGVALNPQHN